MISQPAKLKLVVKQIPDIEIGAEITSMQLCNYVNISVLRNCLMDQNHVVKIADFGLSQKMFLQDYYR